MYNQKDTKRSVLNKLKTKTKQWMANDIVRKKQAEEERSKQNLDYQRPEDVNIPGQGQVNIGVLQQSDDSQQLYKLSDKEMEKLPAGEVGDNQKDTLLRLARAKLMRDMDKEDDEE